MWNIFVIMLIDCIAKKRKMNVIKQNINLQNKRNQILAHYLNPNYNHWPKLKKKKKTKDQEIL